MFRRRLIVLLVLSSVLSSVGVARALTYTFTTLSPAGSDTQSCGTAMALVGGVPTAVGYGGEEGGTQSVKNGDPVTWNSAGTGTNILTQIPGPPAQSHGLGHRRRRGHRGERQDDRSQQRNRLFPHFRQHFGHPFAKTDFERRLRCCLRGAELIDRGWARGIVDTAVALPKRSSGRRRVRLGESRRLPNLPGGAVRQRFSRPESGQRHQLRRHRGGLVQCACHRWQRQPISGRGHMDQQRVGLGGQ